MYKYAVLSFGYAESSSVSTILLSRYLDKKEFETKKALLKDVAEYLLEIYKTRNEVGWSTKDCCSDAMEDNSGDYCPKCGADLTRIGRVTVDQFDSYLWSLPSQTCDDWSGECSVYTEGWTPFVTGHIIFDMTKENTVVIDDNAEKELLKLVMDKLIGGA